MARQTSAQGGRTPGWRGGGRRYATATATVSCAMEMPCPQGDREALCKATTFCPFDSVSQVLPGLGLELEVSRPRALHLGCAPEPPGGLSTPRLAGATPRFLPQECGATRAGACPSSLLGGADVAGP